MAMTISSPSSCAALVAAVQSAEDREGDDATSALGSVNLSAVIDRFGTYLVPRQPERPDEQLFTVKELAARWKVCTASIYSLAKSGQLESLRIGNSLRFTAAAIADYEQTRVGAVAERHPDSKREI